MWKSQVSCTPGSCQSARDYTGGETALKARILKTIRTEGTKHSNFNTVSDSAFT